jgi:hypothetical protein
LYSVDDLFAAIAAHLRRHNQRLGQPLVERVWPEAVQAYGGQVLHCRRCGAAIEDGGGLFDVEKLRAERACHMCYAPF